MFEATLLELRRKIDKSIVTLGDLDPLCSTNNKQAVRNQQEYNRLAQHINQFDLIHIIEHSAKQ